MLPEGITRLLLSLIRSTNSLMTCSNYKAMSSLAINFPFAHILGSCFRRIDRWMFACVLGGSCDGFDLRSTVVQRVIGLQLPSYSFVFLKTVYSAGFIEFLVGPTNLNWLITANVCPEDLRLAIKCYWECGRCRKNEVRCTTDVPSARCVRRSVQLC